MLRGKTLAQSRVNSAQKFSIGFRSGLFVGAFISSRSGLFLNHPRVCNAVCVELLSLRRFSIIKRIISVYIKRSSFLILILYLHENKVIQIAMSLKRWNENFLKNIYIPSTVQPTRNHRHFPWTSSTYPTP